MKYSWSDEKGKKGSLERVRTGFSKAAGFSKAVLVTRCTWRYFREWTVGAAEGPCRRGRDREML